MSDKGPERELPLAQRSLVDNCFEEGQYEYGIDVLDKFRGQGYKPPPLHIRQLVYISLYPLPEKVIERVDFPPSPQKMQFQRQKEDLWPKPTSRPLAVALLKAFLGTSSPQCLMRALPFHIYINSEGVRDVDPFCNEEISEDYSEDNSPLKNELRTMQSLKDCWGLLKNGFVKRKQLDRARVDDSAASHQSDDAIVGPYAWPVLEWLIKIFEKDEQQGKKQGHAPYSALLLTQIPEPRTKQGPRCDAEMPLRVAFACFSFASHTADRPEDMHTSSEAPCDLGARLISLLINLTLTQPPLLSPSHLLHSLTTLRLPNLLLHPLHAFFSTFSTRHAFFKVAVLERYISTSSRRDDESKRTTGTSISRAKPKFVGNSDACSSGTLELQVVYKDPYPMPSKERLLALLSAPLCLPCESSTSMFTLTYTHIALAKFHLVSTLYALHLRGLADSQWDKVIMEGALRKCILSGFNVKTKIHAKHEDAEEGSHQDIQNYKGSALAIVTAWDNSIGR